MSSTPTTKCFAHYHMTAPEYALWDVCRSLSYQTGVLYFNGRSVAGRFQSMAKSTAYNLADSLTEKGWFKLVKESARRKDGTFSPKQYSVLSHEDWIKEHPNQCSLPVQNEGLDEDSPVQLQNSPVQLQNRPVQPEGHNLIGNTDKNQLAKEPDYLRASPNSGLGEFVNQFSKRRKPKQTIAAAAAPTWRGEPVQPSGQVVHDTQAESERLALPIINALKLQHPDAKKLWNNSIKSLLDQGHPPEKIQAVTQFGFEMAGREVMLRNGPAGFERDFVALAEVMAGHQKERISA